MKKTEILPWSIYPFQNNDISGQLNGKECHIYSTKARLLQTVVDFK